MVTFTVTNTLETNKCLWYWGDLWWQEVALYFNVSVSGGHIAYWSKFWKASSGEKDLNLVYIFTAYYT